MSLKPNIMLHASISEDLQSVRQAIAAGADVQSVNADGQPALHVAVSHGSSALSITSLLIEAGASLDMGREEDGRTALHCSCDDGSGLDVVACLLEAGADPNAMDLAGWTPLHCAAYMGAAAYVQALIQHGAKVDLCNSSGQTALLLASESCSSRWVDKESDYTMLARHLLDGGADVSARDSCGDGALDMAVRAGGQTEMVQLLCSRGAPVNATSGPMSNCLTPMHLTSALGDIATLRVLLVAGADVEPEDLQEGLTPLMVAAQSGRESVARALLAAGANPHRCSPRSGLTAVHLAAQAGQAGVLRALLMARPQAAAPAIREATDSTASVAETAAPSASSSPPGSPSALHMACHGGHLEAAQMLLGWGVGVCSVDANLDTPLHVAAQGGHEAVVRLLLSCPLGTAASGMKNASGQTPKDLAARGSRIEAAFSGHP